MTTSTCTMIAEINKMMTIFSASMSSRFNEINANFAKLNIRLANIERQRSPKAREATTNELEEETKRVMEDASHAFLKRRHETPTTTTPPDLVDAVANKLFTTSSPSTEPPRSIVDTTATTSWSSSKIIIDNDDDSTDIDPCMMMLIGAPNSAVRGGRTMLLAGAILGQGVRILVDTGATHNVIDSSTARTIGLGEHRITTTVLIGTGTELACRGACFTVPLRIDGKTF